MNIQAENILEAFKLILLLAAFALGFWNYLRLQNLDEKSNYKDKRNLYKECTEEAKKLIEKITIEKESLFQRRNDFDLLGSSYIGSHGYQEAYSEYMKHIRDIQSQNDKVVTIYNNLSNVVNKSEKETFDIYTAFQKELKDIYIDSTTSLAKAKALVDGIESMANYIKNNA